MKLVLATVTLSMLMIGGAAAQVAPLDGQYVCIQNCRGPGFAYVTQNRDDLNLVNEAGVPSRAWVDYPGHIWADNWDMGAIYSADALTIQFDNGSVWRRSVAVLPPPPPPPPPLSSRG
jgi:hypothetical protein